MILCVRKFLLDIRGAVTTDWTALTAAVLLLGLVVVYALFRDGIFPLAAKMGESFEEMKLPESVTFDYDFSLKSN